jgi:hypothetical protein
MSDNKPRRGRIPASESGAQSIDVPERRAPDTLPQLEALAIAEAEGKLPSADRRDATAPELQQGYLGDVGDAGDVGDQGTNSPGFPPWQPPAPDTHDAHDAR